MSDKPRFYSHIDRPKTVPSPNGTELLDTYTEQIKDGIKTIIKTGKTNVYDKIQASLEGTKIENVLQRLSVGDLSVLREAEPTFIDCTEMPKTMQEAQNLILKCKNEFETFPKEIKEKFDYSVDKYIEEMGTEKFYKKIGAFNDLANEKLANITESKTVTLEGGEATEWTEIQNHILRPFHK